ncbi:FUSC family protein [Flavobacterium agrisoli]|uniref:FUSC family protein n=1 Tax=Flavobacterium agrisoli TaxID=2793066 RepID=A0A934PIW1_9FLAO|nr:FUSC family membrane protein [Flavobacterium agrisoli]MBK0368214.1 FUSC family protein [Flavobacterium agrisoli]
MLRKIIKHAQSVAFASALKVTIAAALPAVIFSWMGQFDIGVACALGAFYAHPTDIPSTIRHKVNGLLVASAIFAGLILIVNLTYHYNLIFYPVLAILLFASSMLTVYGQRASQVSFSALLAISLSFAHIREGWEALWYALYTFSGGIFYLLVSLAFHYVQPFRYVEIELAELIRLTAKYLKLRGDLWNVNADRPKIIQKQLDLQVKINEIHENLRQILFSNKINSGISGQSKKLLIAFITLVEIQELALSTSFDHDKLIDYLKDHPEVLEDYQDLAYKLASKLKKLSTSVHKSIKYGSKQDINKALKKLEQAVENYKNDREIDNRTEVAMMLANMSKYAKNQVEKIRMVDRAFALAIKSFDFKERNKGLEQFMTQQYYPLSTFFDNLSFSSSFFRHSLRLTCTIMVGFLIGKVLPFQNVYWILLTIVVIMRPGYGLTKERSYNRTIGTLVGAVLAFGIVSITTSHLFLSTLAIVCMLIGIYFNQSNYKIGATFITMYVVFVYGIMTPNIHEVIQFRIADTLVGATLAFLANHFLWPSWEFLNTKNFITHSVDANRLYLKETAIYYNNKGIIPIEYRLARKHAFIEIGNLTASFQRMLQEPKSKQKLLPQINKLAVLNHSLLSATASLGTYIQSHKTTSASESFNFIVETVSKKLSISVSILNKEPYDFNPEKDQQALNMRFDELKKVREKIYALNDEKSHDQMQEVQLVIEQLTWMNNIANNILRVSQEFVAANTN